MSIHSRIKERRLALGMTSHKALAERVGVSWQTVQLWEKEGGTAPNRNRLDKVAAELGVSANWLMSGVDERGQQSGGGGGTMGVDYITYSSASADGGSGNAGEGGGGNHLSGKGEVLIVEAKKVEQKVEYIFATHEEIRLLTLFRTADERERSELMDRLKALTKVVKLPTLVGGDKP